MKFSIHSLSLSLVLGGLFAAGSGCKSEAGAGLRNCFDTGSSVVCVQSAVLSTADQDVDHDGKPDKFVCADDDNDDHDRDRDRDHSGATTPNADKDDDKDGICDDLDCGHRTECHALQNRENGGEGEDDRIESSLKGSSGGSTGGSTGGDDHGSSGGSSGGDDHGSSGDDSTDGSGRDDHAETGCTPPVVTPPPPTTPPADAGVPPVVP